MDKSKAVPVSTEAATLAAPVFSNYNVISVFRARGNMSLTDTPLMQVKF